MIEKTNLNPNEVGDIVVGTVLAPGSERAIECRMAAFYAGFPGTSSLWPFLSFCSCFIFVQYNVFYGGTCFLCDSGVPTKNERCNDMVSM